MSSSRSTSCVIRKRAATGTQRAPDTPRLDARARPSYRPSCLPSERSVTSVAALPHLSQETPMAAATSDSSTSIGLTPSDRARDLHDAMIGFLRDRVLPAEHAYET